MVDKNQQGRRPQTHIADPERSHEDSSDSAAGSTVHVPEAELETLESMLRKAPSDVDFSVESACRRAINAAEGLAEPVADAGAPQTQLDAPPIDELGQYEIIEKLGEGGMGAVYKARHRKLEKDVAVKVLPAERLKDQAAVARFEREMRAVGRLSHANLVAAHDAGEVDGNHYLVMELVDGVDLSTAVRRCGPLPIAEACEVIRQAAEGLAHAAQFNMVHRDIKPGNLMVTGDGQVKILDMGLALLDEMKGPGTPELTSTGQMMGTLDYMAPEQGSNSHGVDIRADIYALGATLYKLLTGQAPFGGEKYDSPMAKMMALATENPRPVIERRGDVPKKLSALIARMLAKKPDDRPSTPEEVIELLAPFCAGAQLDEVARIAIEKDGVEEAEPSGDTFAHLKSSYTNTVPSEVRTPLARAAGSFFGGRRWPTYALFSGGAAAIVILLAVVITLRTPQGVVEISFPDGVDHSDVSIALKKDGETVEIANAKNDWTIRVEDGKYDVEMRGGGDRFQLSQNSVKVRRDQNALLALSIRRAPVSIPSDNQQANNGTPAAAPAPDLSPQPVEIPTAYLDEEKTWPLIKLKAKANTAAWIGHTRNSSSRSSPVAMSQYFEEYCPEYLRISQNTIIEYPIPEGVKSFSTTIQNVVDRKASIAVSVDGEEVVGKKYPTIERIAFDLPPDAKKLQLKTTWTHGDYVKCYWVRPRLHRVPVEALASGVREDDVVLAGVEPTVLIGRVSRSTKVENEESLVWSPPLLSPDARCRDYLIDHAPSSSTYEIPDGAERFRTIGMAKYNESLQFAVDIDGERAYTSPRCGTVKIDVVLPKDAKELTIRLIAPRGNIDAHARWCFPRFVKIKQSLPSNTPVRFVNRKGGLTLAVHGGSEKQGARMSVEKPADDDPAQQWIIEPADGGFVYLKNRKSELYYTYDEAKKGEKFTQWKLDPDDPAFLWKIEPIRSEFFKVTNKKSGLCLSIWGSDPRPGQYVIQWPFSLSSTAHYWKIEAVAEPQRSGGAKTGESLPTPTAQLRTEFPRGDKSVMNLAVSPDGQRVFSGNSINRVAVWDLAAAKPVTELKGHQHRIEDIALSRGGKLLASASADDTVVLWDTEKLQPIAKLEGHDDDVNAVAISPDALQVASGTRSGQLFLWDVEKRATRHRLDPKQEVYGVAFSADVRRIVTSHDQYLRVWDTKTGALLQAVKVHGDKIYHVIYSPDGKYLATCCRDHSIKLFHAGAKVEEIGQLGRHDGEVRDISFSPDGRLLLSGGLAGQLKLWDVARQEHLLTIDYAEDSKQPIEAVAFAPNGRTILAGGRENGRIRVWDVTGVSSETDFIRLTELKPMSVQDSKRRPFRATTSGDGPRISPRAHTAGAYIFTRAPSRIRYAVPQGTKSFSADGFARASWAVTFKVVAGSETLFRSDKGWDSVRVDLPPGAETIDLIASEKVAHDSSDFWWVAPRLYPVPAEEIRHPYAESGDHVDLTRAKPILARVNPAETFVSRTPEGLAEPVMRGNPGSCRDYIYAYPETKVQYKVPDGVTAFSSVAYCGNGSVRFKLYAGDTLIYESPRAGVVPVKAAIPDGTSVLTLTTEGWDFRGDAYWCYPRLHRGTYDVLPNSRPTPPNIDWASFPQSPDRRPKLPIPASGILKLTELEPFTARVGRDAFTVNSAGGRPWPEIRPDVQVAEEYLYAPAPSRIRFAVPDDVKSFTAAGFCANYWTAAFKVVADGKTLFESEATKTADIQVDLPTGTKTIDLIVLRRHAKDAAPTSWVCPRLHKVPADKVEDPFAAEGDHIKLTKIKPVEIDDEQNNVLVNRVPEGMEPPVIVDRFRRCEEFIYAFPPSRVEFEIPQGVTRFSAIGHSHVSGTVRFEVYADDQRIYRSGVAGIVPIDVEIPAQATTLTLAIDPAGNDFRDYSFWCYPRFHASGGQQGVYRPAKPFPAGGSVDEKKRWLVAELKRLNPGLSDDAVRFGISRAHLWSVELKGPRVKDIRPIVKLQRLDQLAIGGTQVEDLSQLEGANLKAIIITGIPATDLSPLGKMPRLESIHMLGMNVDSLAALKSLRLKDLRCQGCTQISELSPLKGMPLRTLEISQTAVADLTPVALAPLRELNFDGTKVKDLRPLLTMPVKTIRLDLSSNLDLSILGRIKTLEKVNGRPVADVLAAYKQAQDLKPFPKDAASSARIAWLVAELERLNPKRSPKTRFALQDEEGEIVSLLVHTGGRKDDGVTDISPAKHVKTLQKVAIGKTAVADLSPLAGNKLTALAASESAVEDLSPLKGMPLEYLRINHTRVKDISPLEGMPLKYLDCEDLRLTDLSVLNGMPLVNLNLKYNNKLVDITPLREMPLTKLVIGGTDVADLSPLKGAPLTHLIADGCRFESLAPLAGAPLEHLEIHKTPVADIEPLAGMPLVSVRLNFRPEHAAVLGKIKTLKKINGEPAEEYLAEAKK